MNSPASATGIVVDVPGRGRISIARVFLDFTGTLSADGQLLTGVAERLRLLAAQVPITVLTADTFGTAREALMGLPVEFREIRNGAEKERIVQQCALAGFAAIGNGMNDVAMIRAADLGIAVVGSEGAASELLRVAGVVVTNINDALDLLLKPLRLKATLRE
ncbi:MAG: ATPase P [Acidobacteriota bacterium]